MSSYSSKKRNTPIGAISVYSQQTESLNSKYDELIVYIEELRIINFKYSVICLQETWLSENDDLSPFHCKNVGQWLTQPTNNFQLISTTKIKSNSETVY